MRILITGAGGFVGRAIAAEFFGPGNDLFLTFHKKPLPASHFPPENCFAVDLTNPSEVLRLSTLKQVDSVIHVAGLAHQFGHVRAEDFYKVNVTATENVLRLANKLSAERFVLISSVAVYGRDPRAGKSGVTEEAVCRPAGPYSESKLAAEFAALKFCAENRMHLTILRPATVVGEGDPGNVRRLIEAIDRGKFRWIGNGENRKSLVYRDDVARACRSAVEGNPDSPAIFNVAGESLQMREFVSYIAAELGRKIPAVRVPAGPVRFALRTILGIWRPERLKALSETVDKWIADDVYSTDKIAESLGFRAETPVIEALRREIAAYAETR